MRVVARKKEIGSLPNNMRDLQKDLIKEQAKLQALSKKVKQKKEIARKKPGPISQEDRELAKRFNTVRLNIMNLIKKQVTITGENHA